MNSFDPHNFGFWVLTQYDQSWLTNAERHPKFAFEPDPLAAQPFAN